MKKSPLPSMLIFAGICLCMLSGFLLWQAVIRDKSAAGSSEALPAMTTLRETAPVPPFSLDGMDGAKGSVTQAMLTGKWTFLFFGYTQCPDVCPTALGLMKELAARLKTTGAPAFQVLFISVDPARDTPALLRSYLASFSPSFVGASGSDMALAPLVKHLGVVYQRNDSKGDKNYTVDHTTTIFLVDPETRLAAAFSPPQLIGRLEQDFLRITGAHNK